jgi:hypothetical protein
MINWYEVYGAFPFSDIFIIPIYLLLILLIGYQTQRAKVKENPVYRYYFKGLIFKLFCAISFCLVFTFYYNEGGDTLNYFTSAKAMSNLMFVDLNHYLDLLINGSSLEKWTYFNSDTGFPMHFMFKDPKTFMVSRLTSVIMPLTNRSLIGTTLILSYIAYTAIWKLFLFFTHFYPKLDKQLAIAVLFMPSVTFWSSGIMKDTYTFAALAWFVYNIFQVLIKKEKIPINIFLAIVNAALILSIKPYIFIALLPGAVLWAFYQKISNIKSAIVKGLILPFILIAAFGVVSLIFSKISSSLGEYANYDQMVTKAKNTQEDLLDATRYGKNNYNIGKIDGSTSGMLKIAPNALIAGLFRPFIWEARSVFIAVSGIENAFLLFSIIFLLIKLKFVRFFKYLFSEPVLMFSFVFTVFFVFGVGLSSTNFGALVRYRIPAIPFFVATVFIMFDKYKQRHSAFLESIREDKPQPQ